MTHTDTERTELAAMLDYDEAASALGTTRRHLRELVFRREIAHVKVGRKVRFSAHDLEEYVSTHRVAPASPAA